MRVQHPLEVHGVQQILDDGLEVHEMSMRDLLRKILFELQRMNKHLQLITDEEIEADDS